MSLCNVKKKGKLHCYLILFSCSWLRYVKWENEKMKKRMWNVTTEYSLLSSATLWAFFRLLKICCNSNSSNDSGSSLWKVEGKKFVQFLNESFLLFWSFQLKRMVKHSMKHHSVLLNAQNGWMNFNWMHFANAMQTKVYFVVQNTKFQWMVRVSTSANHNFFSSFCCHFRRASFW